MRRLLMLLIGLLLAVPIALISSGRITVVVQPDVALSAAGTSVAGGVNATALPVTVTTTSLSASASQPSPTRSPTPPYHQAGTVVDLRGVTHVWQTWNNCGPATLAMYFSYYGADFTQEEIADALRPGADDRNVSAEELVGYALRHGYESLTRVNGDVDLLRLLLSNGVPVLVETWYEPEGEEGMGHYRLLTGYDDATREWFAYDSYDTHDLRVSEEYAGMVIPYADLERLWPVQNRRYLLVYPSDRAEAVEAMLGEDFDEDLAWQRAIAAAEAEITLDRGNAFAWFNLGSDLAAVGRYDEAAAAYQNAEAIGWPQRMLWYQFGVFEAAIESGRPEWAIALADEVIEMTEGIEEVWYWKGAALVALGESEGARLAFEKALAVNPGYTAALSALLAL